MIEEDWHITVGNIQAILNFSKMFAKKVWEGESEKNIK